MSTYRIVKIGRAKDNDIVRTDASVSRYHCEIHFDEFGNAFLKDCNSTNGTFVNGNKVNGNLRLDVNDIVRLGIDVPLPWNEWKNGIKPTEKPPTVINSSYGEMETIQPRKRKSQALTLIVLIVLAVAIVVTSLIFFFRGSSYSATSEEEPEIIDESKQNDLREQPVLDPEKDATTKKITYDFSCLGDASDYGTSEVIDMLESADKEITKNLTEPVSLKEEIEYGELVYKDTRSQYDFVSSGKRLKNLENLLNILVSKIENSKGFRYSIYLIQSKELNAFTAGGKIFVTTGMYDFCKSNDELACVVGHEIYHNELGHINEILQKQNLLSPEGAMVLSAITASFGQKKETHCDMKGIDLAIAAGFNACVSVELWDRMKKVSGEGDFNVLDNIFRTHPYSEKRGACNQNHILTNYKFDCSSSEN
jgi:pSer/pThr/pTyr-binding forkhead associated (FHA) protein/Zn-dependent protease with chaperone function